MPHRSSCGLLSFILKAVGTHMVEYWAGLPVNQIGSALAVALRDLRAALQQPPEAQLEKKAGGGRRQRLHVLVRAAMLGSQPLCHVVLLKFCKVNPSERMCSSAGWVVSKSGSYHQGPAASTSKVSDSASAQSTCKPSHPSCTRMLQSLVHACLCSHALAQASTMPLPLSCQWQL